MNSDITIIDNFLNSDTSNEIEQELSGTNFPWFYCEHSTTYTNEHKDMLKNKNLKIKSYLQFTHDFYIMSKKTKIMHASKKLYLVNKIIDEYIKRYNKKSVEILRVKANFNTQTTNTDTEYHDLPHIDRDDLNHTVLLYYVNDSDGDTILFDNDLNILKKVTPKKNRVLIFNGKTLHAGSNPIQSKKRIGINFNFGIRNEH